MWPGHRRAIGPLFRRAERKNTHTKKKAKRQNGINFFPDKKTINKRRLVSLSFFFNVIFLFFFIFWGRLQRFLFFSF